MDAFEELLNAPPLVSKKTKKYYRDVWYAPNTQLAEALEAGDKLLAEKVYWTAEVEFQKHMKGTRWAKPEGEAERMLAAAEAKLEERRKAREALEAERAKKK
jgi:hypothetical protein